MSNTYARLLSPLDVGPVQLPNRIIMGSMHTGLEEAPNGFERMAEFYALRAAGGAGLIVTGGVAPNESGRIAPGATMLADDGTIAAHRIITERVHAAGGCILLQILHAGRYAFHTDLVAPSAIQAPINIFRPQALESDEVIRQIDDFARCAALAKDAGYDGVEVMGSEGYLINQFIAARTNHRDDEWGGDFQGRSRFPVRIVRAVRDAAGPDFLIMFRLSMIDLVDGGSTWEEVVSLGRQVVAAGADIINTGIGWHEARIPTIAAMVPRAAFAGISGRFKAEVDVPVVTTNRINTPETAEAVLERGDADLISMARPLLADPDFGRKAAQGRADAINVCIACNQACLDHIFTGETATCLVNPAACHETELVLSPAETVRQVAVVGSGPAGMACALTAARRGHRVTLYDHAAEPGGQLQLAVRVPGKEEFYETLRYFKGQLAEAGVDCRFGTAVTAEALTAAAVDVVVMATGVRPRMLDFPGSDSLQVVSYADVFSGRRSIGPRVAIVGAGGIGVDMAVFLSQPEEAEEGIDAFMAEWGVDPTVSTPGGLLPEGAAPTASPREIYLLQRKSTKIGKNLGKTTGWIHRATLNQRGVTLISSATYERVDAQGFHIRVKDEARTLQVDHVVICAGQESNRDLEQTLTDAGQTVHIIGGASDASGIDAKRAIADGVRLAAEL